MGYILLLLLLVVVVQGATAYEEPWPPERHVSTPLYPVRLLDVYKRQVYHGSEGS